MSTPAPARGFPHTQPCPSNDMPRRAASCSSVSMPSTMHGTCISKAIDATPWTTAAAALLRVSPAVNVESTLRRSTGRTRRFRRVA
jgi:hypothetical protein